MTRLTSRLAKLEAQVASPTQRLWQICLHEDETKDEALARHGVPTQTPDLVVLLHRYGKCRACRAAASGEAPGVFSF